MIKKYLFWLGVLLLSTFCLMLIIMFVFDFAWIPALVIAVAIDHASSEALKITGIDIYSELNKLL